MNISNIIRIAIALTLTIMLFGFFIYGTINMINNMIKRQEYEYDNRFSENDPKNIFDLIAMEVGGGIEGSFFLGTGSIDSKEYFYFWIERKDGSMSRMSIKTNHVRVKYTDEHPRAIQTQFEDRGIPSVWVLYIPRGSIVPQFNTMRNTEDGL